MSDLKSIMIDIINIISLYYMISYKRYVYIYRYSYRNKCYTILFVLRMRCLNLICRVHCFASGSAGASNVKPEVPGSVAHESFAACPAPVLGNVNHTPHA